MYILDIPYEVAVSIRSLPPDVKISVREALRALVSDPDLGQPLRGGLKGFWKYRVRRYRIVYKKDEKRKKLFIYAVGHRREIYDRLTKEN